MLTIFTVPKPFEGQIALIQRNAIASWSRLGADCQLIICGDEAGAGEVAAEFGADHIPEVERNELGTPLLNSVFRQVEERATCETLCYANADLIFFPDFLEAVKRVSAEMERFLLVGETWDLEVTTDYAAEPGGWEADLRHKVSAAGTARAANWIDFFIYPRGALGALPPFAVGRPGWDNWMIYRARSLRVPVVDVSPATTVVHQQHGYGHVQQATGSKWQGPEADRNSELLGLPKRIVFSLVDATHRLTPTELVAAPAPDLRGRIRTRMLLSPVVELAFRGARALYRPLRGLVRRLK